MITLEEMQEKWQAQARQIEEAASLSRDLRSLERLRKLRTPLQRFRNALQLEIGSGVLAMLALGNFGAKHWAEPRFVCAAAALDLWVLAALIAAVRQWVMAGRIGYEEPIATVQERLAGLRIVRLKAFRWLFLTGQIVWWIPFVIVACKMFFDLDAYRYLSPRFIEINLLAGVLIIPAAIYAAKRVRLPNIGSWRERLLDTIAGRSLVEAQAQAKQWAGLD